MSLAATPHDTLFKHIFSHPEQAAAHLQSVLPKVVVQAIDWPSLALAPGTWLDASWREGRADLAFSAQSYDAKPVRLVVLLEHQSSSDRRMVRRVDRYTHAAWDDFEKTSVYQALTLATSGF